MKNDLTPDLGSDGRSADDSEKKSKDNSLSNGYPKDVIPKFTQTATNKNILKTLDIICLCHLRWNFVFQRPQHLLTRFAKQQRVLFIEEPIFETIDKPYISENICHTGVHIFTPHLPEGLSEEEKNNLLENLLGEILTNNGVKEFVLWYYTPMALKFSRSLKPTVTVYDCMDELSAFKFAPADLLSLEEELMKKADVMYTGGMNLYEHKRSKHTNIQGFPSSIDRAHFMSGLGKPDPEDQVNIPHPRAGFYGVVDERMDLELIDGIAKQLPDWHFVIIGPVVKIDPATLPSHPNIYYLGGKDYKELPSYLAGWDVALLPFAINESTEFISPTKTPEYLSALKPVVSTPIIDVAKPYGEQNLVHIASNVDEFVEAIKLAVRENDNDEWKEKVEGFLSQNSWDKTWDGMTAMIEKVLVEKKKSYSHKLDASSDTKRPVATIFDYFTWKTRLEKMLGKNYWEKTWLNMKTLWSLQWIIIEKINCLTQSSKR